MSIIRLITNILYTWQRYEIQLRKLLGSDQRFQLTRSDNFVIIIMRSMLSYSNDLILIYILLNYFGLVWYVALFIFASISIIVNINGNVIKYHVCPCLFMEWYK